MPPPVPIVCEILAPHATQAGALAEIASFVAHGFGQPVILKTRAAEDAALTLNLPVELAATQHPVWCLACRLACFCPDARVSVLVRGYAVFTPTQRKQRRALVQHLRARRSA